MRFVPAAERTSSGSETAPAKSADAATRTVRVAVAPPSVETSSGIDADSGWTCARTPPESDWPVA